jgi:hypothetical protein
LSFSFPEKVYIENIKLGFSNAKHICVKFQQVKDGKVVGETLVIEKEIEEEKPKSVDATALITEEEAAKINEQSIELKIGEPKDGAKFNRCRIELKVLTEDYTSPINLYYIRIQSMQW